MKNNKKVILGLNGWFERGHDASACLIIGDKIISFAEEERFTRKRYSYDSLPIFSIAYCMSQSGINVSDIDHIVFGWDIPKIYSLNKNKFNYSNQDIIQMFFPKNIYKYEKMPTLEFIDHYTSHAASSYRISGYKKSSILILDGQGEDASGALAYGDNGEIKIINKIPIAFSVGYMMEAACKYLGMRTSDVGKLMGLASYGKSKKTFNNIVLNDEGFLINNFPKDKSLFNKSLDQQEVVISYWINFFKQNFSFKNKIINKFDLEKNSISKSISFKKEHKVFASIVQNSLEKVIIHLVKILIKKTKCKKLIISGGVGLNCTTNGKLISEKIIDNLFVSPLTNDSGVSLGAALEKAYRLYGFSYKQLSNIYLGPKFTNKQIEKILNRNKISYIKSKNICKIAAKSIHEGKVVSWFQGRMEGGPRALGNRSIFANPKVKKMHDLVNRIKNRENWRPLAPAILSEFQKDYFECDTYSPFMLLSNLVKKNKRKEIPAVVHIDGTARYQTVKKNINKKYYSLIKEFYKLSKTPLILNTSFNIGGEPLVCTPYDAIKTFYLSEIDCLAIEDYWITK